MSVYERLMDETAQKRRANVAGQVSLFDAGISPAGAGMDAAFVIPDMPEHNRKALLSMERETTGVYISGHPLDEVADLLGSGFTTVADVQEMAEGEERGAAYDGAQASMAGILTMCKGKITKKGSMMGFLTLEDLTGQIEGLVFPKVYEKYVSMLVADSLVIAEGKLSFREEEEPKLLVDSVRPLNAQSAGLRPAQASGERHAPGARAASAKRKISGAVAEPENAGMPESVPLTDAQRAKQAEHKLYLLVPTREELEGVKAACAERAGGVPVYVKLKDEGIALLLSREYWSDGGGESLASLRARYGEANVVLR